MGERDLHSALMLGGKTVGPLLSATLQEVSHKLLNPLAMSRS